MPFDILLEVAHPILIQILNILFGFVLGFYVFLMGMLKLFGMLIDKKAAEYFTEFVNDLGVIMNQT